MNKIQEEFNKHYYGFNDKEEEIRMYNCFEAGYKSANLLPTEKVCPECGGGGREYIDSCHDCEIDKSECGDHTMCSGNICDNCIDGIIQIYYTPEDYKRITGKDYPDDALVWVWFTAVSNFVPDFYRKCKTDRLIIYIIQTAQPAPEEDWRWNE